MKYKALRLCDFPRSSANTIRDHVTNFKKHSRGRFFFYNPVLKNKPDWLKLNDFDIIAINYSIYVI